MIALVSSFASFAAADPGSLPPGLTGPVASDATPQPPDATPLDLAIQRDAAGDRAFALGTANALPAGALDFSLRGTIFGELAGVAAGVGHGVELSMASGMSFFKYARTFGAGVKVTLVRRPTWALAIDANANRYDTEGSSETFAADGSLLSVMTTIQTGGIFTAGAKLTSCGDDDCQVVSTLGIGAGVGLDPDGRVERAGFANMSMIAGTGTVRALGEVGYLAADGSGVVLGFAGMRIGGRRFAADLGLGFGISTTRVNDAGALPLAGVSYRP